MSLRPYRVEKLWERYPLGISPASVIPVKIRQIQNVVALYTGVSVTDLMSTRKPKHIARARHIAQYLCTTLTDVSYKEIGMRFNRDHTSVMHAHRKISHALKYPDAHDDAMLARDIEAMSRMALELAETKTEFALMESST